VWFETIRRMQAANTMRDDPTPGSHADDLQRVKQALLQGLVITTLAPPEARAISNTPAVRRHMPMCKERAQYYLSLGALEILSSEPDIIQPLHVVSKPGRKDRLVLDLSRNLNDLVETEHFRQSSIADAIRVSSPGCWYGKMDLSDCFLSFDVHPDSRKFLAFELDGTFYQFSRMPFGLCSAPFWCDLFLKVIDFALREQGIVHVRYVDDFLFVSDTPAGVSSAFAAATAILEAHGLRINNAKTEGPVQQIIFLGLGLDSRTQTLFVPDSKANQVRAIIGNFNKQTSTTRGHIQTLVGKMSFVAAALPGARPFYRHLIDATRQLKHAYSRVSITDHMREDLHIWSQFLTKWNGSARWRAGATFVIDHDASKSGFGFLLVGAPHGFDPDSLPATLRPGNAFAGLFSGDELASLVADSIQWAELFAIAYSVALYAPYLQGSDLLARTDNLTDTFIINRQRTAAPQLLRLLRFIYITCAHYNISISAQHIPGELNILADYLSRPALHAFRDHIACPALHQHVHMHVVNSSSFLPPTAPHQPARCSFKT
jgi:hypothetical protein